MKNFNTLKAKLSPEAREEAAILAKKMVAQHLEYWSNPTSNPESIYYAHAFKDAIDVEFHEVKPEVTDE